MSPQGASELGMSILFLCLTAAAAPLRSAGELTVLTPDGPGPACPLEHTAVEAKITGWVAAVTVTQRFANPSETPIEAVYTFPLPHDGAVFDMRMTIGERVIRADIQTREQARQTFEQARAEGHTAALLEQERPNIFTQSVTNLPPGVPVEVMIRYSETLPYRDGVFRFIFPMVVGPRYMPGSPIGHRGTGWSPDTSQVPDASRISPPVTPPDTRAGHDISITVDLDAGADLRELACTTHEVTTEPRPRGARLALAGGATIPNKDFILEYRTTDEQVGDAVLSHRDEAGGYFAVVLQPPRRVLPEAAVPRELVFVLDTSGSMNGLPIETAKATMSRCLAGLNPEDTFNLITFAGTTSMLFAQPVPATAANLAEAQAFVAARQGRGGTEMMTAIRAALTASDSQRHVRLVCFMTDGFVGNDQAILDEIARHPNARVFSFGIGSSVNRYLLDGMALAGRGEVEYVPLDNRGFSPGASDPGSAAERFSERIASPVLTDISIDWGDLPVADLLPSRPLDLFSAKPVVVLGRYTAGARGEVVLRGRTAAGPFERRISVDLAAAGSGNEVLPRLWARARVEALLGANRAEPPPEVVQQVTALGLEYRLMTPYTSFVAVEVMTIVEGGEPRTVVVPVEMPEGVSYEGVFGDAVFGRQDLAPQRAARGGFGGGFGAPGAVGAPGPRGPAAPPPEPPRFDWVPGRRVIAETGRTTPVTIDVHNARLLDVLNLLAQSAPGLEIRCAAAVDAEERITVKFGPLPFDVAISILIGAPYVNLVEQLGGALLVDRAGGPAQRAEANELLPLLLKADADLLASPRAAIRVTLAAPDPTFVDRLGPTGVTLIEQISDTELLVVVGRESVIALARMEEVKRLSLP